MAEQEKEKKQKKYRRIIMPQGIFYVVDDVMFPTPMSPDRYIFTSGGFTPEDVYRYIKGYENAEKKVQKRLFNKVADELEFPPSGLRDGLQMGKTTLGVAGVTGIAAYLLHSSHPIIAGALSIFITATATLFGIFLAAPYVYVTMKAKERAEKLKMFTTQFVDFLRGVNTEGTNIREWGENIIKRIENEENITLDELPPEFVKYLLKEYPELGRKIINYVKEKMPISYQEMDRELQRWRPEDVTSAISQRIREKIVESWLAKVDRIDIDTPSSALGSQSEPYIRLLQETANLFRNEIPEDDSILDDDLDITL
jgi:hypothetical protein